MKTLSKQDCSEWLADRGIEENPYYSKNSRAPYISQFDLSNRDGAICRSVVTAAEPFETALLHVTDWALYQPDEMTIFSQIRNANGEQRPLIETPGHVFNEGERDLLIGMFALATSYGWTAYLYFDHRTTLLSWEGDLLDLWSFDDSRHNAIQEVLRSMGLHHIG